MISSLNCLGGSGGNGVPVKDPAPGPGCDLHERPAAFSNTLPVHVLAEPDGHRRESASGNTRTEGEARESTPETPQLKADSRGGQKKFVNHNRGRNPNFLIQEMSGVRETRELPISATEMDMAYRHFWIRRGFAEHEIPAASAWQVYPVEPDEGRILPGYFSEK